MDKHRTEGTKHEIKGAVKEGIGKVTNNPHARPKARLRSMQAKPRRNTARPRTKLARIIKTHGQMREVRRLRQGWRKKRRLLAPFLFGMNVTTALYINRADYSSLHGVNMSANKLRRGRRSALGLELFERGTHETQHFRASARLAQNSCIGNCLFKRIPIAG